MESCKVFAMPHMIFDQPAYPELLPTLAEVVNAARQDGVAQFLQEIRGLTEADCDIANIKDRYMEIFRRISIGESVHISIEVKWVAPTIFSVVVRL